MSWIAIASLVGSLLTSGFSLWKQQKENKTTRDFNAEEADKNRQWQEDMYNKYESPTAQVLQRMQAGLNPYSDVTSQSVGTGSTASAGSSSLPGLSDPFGQMPSMMMQLKSYKIEQEQKQATLDKTKEETRSITLDNQMKALEAGNKEEWIRLEIELMRQDARGRKASADKLEAEASRAWDIAYQSRHFTEAGGNEFEDTHEMFVAQLEKVKVDTTLTKTQNEIAKHTLSLSQKFDEKFLQLDYDERKTAVDEYLANSENRKEFNQLSHELYKEIQEQAKYELTDVRDKLLSVDAQLAEDLLYSLNDGDLGHFDTVLLKWFQNNPSGILQLASVLIPNVTYAPKTVNPTKIITGKQLFIKKSLLTLCHGFDNDTFLTACCLHNLPCYRTHL